MLQVVVEEGAFKGLELKKGSEKYNKWQLGEKKEMRSEIKKIDFQEELIKMCVSSTGTNVIIHQAENKVNESKFPCQVHKGPFVPTKEICAHCLCFWLGDRGWEKEFPLLADCSVSCRFLLTSVYYCLEISYAQKQNWTSYATHSILF